MKYWVVVWLTLVHITIHAQELPGNAQEQVIEDITEQMDDTEPLDDSWIQETEHLLNHKLDINRADVNELEILRILTPLQITELIRYRKLLGPLISIYELQAIPGWNLSTIEKMLPYISISNTESISTKKERFRAGEHTFIMRFGRQLQLTKGYKIEDSTRNSYLGSASRWMVRYKYNYKNLLQYGFTASKDAGEPFLKAPNTYGFDFYSFHFFTRHRGWVKTFALGDYTINMGQGLIHWQTLAFGKSSAIANMKRQAAVIKPYNAAGSVYFNRGVATSLQKGNWQANLFLSIRNMDGKLVEDENNETTIRSIHLSGYHRTPNEITDKNSFRQTSWGGTFGYLHGSWKLNFNTVQYHFNYPILKEQTPQNLYSIKGDFWSNYSMDYSYTYKNIHLFGETAIDARGSIATVNSLISSLHSQLDFALLHRSISKSYQAVNGNAFTVATNPNNERGLYAGVILRPKQSLVFAAYLDLHQSQWLKYRIDGPAKNKDYLLQLHYKPNKLTELYTRYRVNQRNINRTTDDHHFNEVIEYYNRSWRTQINHALNPNLQLRQRFELLWYDKPGAITEKGFLAYTDLQYKPRGKSYHCSFRIQYFDSDSYNARVYAYESDVLYYYAVPAFFNKGTRLYLNLHYKIRKHIGCWFKIGHTVYDNQDRIGSGLDESEGNKKTEVRFLLSVSF